jgi:type VI secretion system protein ImpK
MSHAAPAPARTANLASAFQEVLTVIVRLRAGRQQVADAESFRAQVRRGLQAAMTEARSLGYASETVQMAVLATVGFLDESVLNQGNPALADWARRPLQEELFGGHLAGETFFHNMRDLLARQDSSEAADALELHALCLLLGYRGRYALGDAGELHHLLRQAREKIFRVRGAPTLAPAIAAVAAPARKPDRLGRGLLIAAGVLVLVTLAAFAGFEASLSSAAARVQYAQSAQGGNVMQ